MEKGFNTFEELVALAPEDVQDRLNRLKSVRERPDYHPEDSAYEHIKIVTERLMTTGDIDLVMAGLYHDLGKIDTIKTNPKSGYIMTPGHEHVSSLLVTRDADFIKSMGADVTQVYDIVKNHMKIKQMEKMKASKQKAMRSLPVFGKLGTFTRADNMLEDF
jgi:hypothetical protein